MHMAQAEIAKLAPNIRKKANRLADRALHAKDHQTAGERDVGA